MNTATATKPLEITLAKRCKDCGESKPLEDFHRCKNNKDGRKGKCKTCSAATWQKANREHGAARSKRWRERHPEKAAASTKRWWAKNAQRKDEYNKRYRERYPEKHRARQAIANAVVEGRIVKPDRCEDCDARTARADLHGHHTDYSKPLEVDWLCRTCHSARHRAAVA